MSNDTSRDGRLGAALRELDVPEHRPEFHRELRRLLEAEQRARGVRRRFLPVGAVAAALAAILVVAVGIPRTHHTGPETASAAIVKAHLRLALVEMRNLSGVLVADGRRWMFTLGAAGDVRLEGPGAGEVITYDAATGVARSAQHSASLGGGRLFYAERDGVAPGPPDQGPPTWILPDDLSAYVRAALAAGNPGVRELTYEGRPAWQLDITTMPNQIAPELSGDRLEVTVDRTTGMPVRVVERKNGKLLHELRIEQLAANRALAADTFRLTFPAGAEVMKSDDGFQRVALDRVAAITGYTPLVPADVPRGYRLAQVAVARESAPTGKEGANPASRMVVSLSYRRGIDEFLVTMRLRGTGTWNDPLASPEGFIDHPERVSAGRLQGELVVSPQTTPHLWALTDTLVVTVGGDLSRAELLQVAASLGK
jgi:hypothetical protein